ncbi:MAG: purine-nucleoside phosphorylase [Solirubrobacteraceae bacterium]|jgi:DeoD family purine-nucleoside phosphorylase|nr:purine-nucleoside phosphorylase [Solirubrobacteraceae bacterium]
MSTGPIHLQPTAPLAERVLLPGDPGRALRLAQALMREPRMFNHHRGLWGYTGTAADDEPLTIQSTGMGGPSAAIIITELALLGAQRLIRVGTCGALDPTIELGTFILAREAIATDGTSRALGAPERATPDQNLTEAIASAAAAEDLHQGPIVTTDLFYDGNRQEEEWAAQGALAVEMETATLFTIAANKGLAAASLLIVTDQVLPKRSRITTDALTRAELRAGEIATAALRIPGGG